METSDPTDTQGDILWWGFEEKSVYQPLIDKFQSENPNTRVEYVRQSTQDYRVRLKESLARSEGPDIFAYHNSWVPMFRGDLDTMPSFVMSPEEFSDIYYPVIVSDLSTNKGIVGIPLEYDALTLFVNEEILATAGKKPPQTWDELKILSRELSQKDGRGILVQAGIPLGFTENVDHWPEILGFMILQNFADPSSPDSERARDALLYYRTFRGDGVWNATLPPSTVAFARGDVALYFGTTERTSEILELNPNLIFKTVNLPQLRKDNPDEPDTAYATYWVQGVWNRSSSRGVAWRFLEFMSRQDSLQEVYTNSLNIKSVGNPYPRIDMSSLIEDDPITGSVIRLAPGARSWYLADNTNDGEQGINSRLGSAYENLLNRAFGKNAKLSSFEKDIQEILLEYGLTVKQSK